MEKIYGERKENGRRSRKKKKHQPFKILLPLYAFNHSRSSGVYAEILRPLQVFSFSLSLWSCQRCHGYNRWAQCPTTQKLNFFSPPFWDRWLRPRVVCPLFEYSRALLEACIWKCSNLPGAHVSPYPGKDGLRLLWVFKNSIFMTTHPKPSCVFLTVMRSYIKSRRAAITVIEQPSVGAGLQLSWSPAMKRGPWI